MTTSTRARRLDALEASLTPQEAVQLWLKEVRQFGSVDEYWSSIAHWLHAMPRMRVARELETSTRRATTGWPPAEASKRVRWAIEEGDFLVMLVLQVNDEVQRAAKDALLETCYLSEQAQQLLMRDAVSNDMAAIKRHLAWDLPYPIVAETARAVDASVRHAVVAWDQFRDFTHDWAYEHFLSLGRKAVPWDLGHVVWLRTRSRSRRQGDGGCEWDPLDPQIHGELAGLFDTPASLERYTAGEDFSHGFADVCDAEFEAVRAKVEAAARELVEKGQVQVGRQVLLPSVPVSFHQAVPLVDGEWLDLSVIEWAELAASLAAQGVTNAGDGDEHPLAHPGFYRVADGDEPTEAEGAAGVPDREVDDYDLQGVREETRRRIGRLKNRPINGRPCVRLEDYRRWKGRTCRDSLVIEAGVVVESWNAWVEARGGDGAADVAGVKISSLPVLSPDYEEQEDPEEARARQRARRQAIGAAGRWLRPKTARLAEGHEQAQDDAAGGGCFEDDVVAFRARVLGYAGRLLLLQETVAAVARSYFEGCEILFADIAKSLTSQSVMLEGTVALYNEVVARRLEVYLGTMQLGNQDEEDGSRSPWCIDIDVLRDEMTALVEAKVEQLVTLAKSETSRVFRKDGTAERLLDHLKKREPAVVQLTGRAPAASR